MNLRDWFRRREDPRGATETSAPGASPPSARRVAGRALALATLHYRIAFENFLLQKDDESSRLANANLLTWVEDVGLLPEFEPAERDLLQAPLGQSPPAAVASESWRLEGLGVLAWALHRYRLPPYDAAVGSAVLEGLELFNPRGSPDLRDTAAVRPLEEIRRYAIQITVVHLRLRQFQLPPGSLVYEEATCAAPSWGHGVGARMDFAAYLRAHPRFQDYWMEGPRLLGGDLALGGQSIADASPEDVQQCTAMAAARQVAAYWLRGDEPLYSRVRPDTLLITEGRTKDS